MVSESVNLREFLEFVSQYNGWIYGDCLRKFIIAGLTKSSNAVATLDPKNSGFKIWFAYDSEWQKFKTFAANRYVKIVNGNRPVIEYIGVIFQVTVGAVFPIIDHDIDGLVFQLKSEYITWASLTLAKPTQLIQQICNHECTLSLDRMQRGFSDACFPYSAPEGFTVFAPALPGHNRVQVDIQDLQDEKYATTLCKPYMHIISPILGDVLLATTVKYEYTDFNAAFVVIKMCPKPPPSVEPKSASESKIQNEELENYCKGIIQRLIPVLNDLPDGTPQCVFTAIGEELILAAETMKSSENRKNAVQSINATPIRTTLDLVVRALRL